MVGRAGGIEEPWLSFSTTAWLISILSHGLAIAGALALHRPMALPPEAPFRWEVTIHEAAPLSPAEHPRAATKMDAQTEHPSVVKNARAIQRSAGEIQPVTHRTVSYDRVARPLPSTVQAVSRPEASQRRLAHIENVVQHVDLHASGLVQRDADLTAPSAVTRGQASTGPVARTETAAVEAPYPAVSAPTVSSAVARAEMSHQSSPVSDPAIVEAQPVSTPAVHASESMPLADHRPIAETVRVQERGAIQTKPLREIPSAQLHYGWLKEALTAKIEQMKRYPEVAAERRWEGRVVVRGVVTAEGELKDLVVVESSGFRLLDDEALDLLRRISPLALKHPLGQSRVTLRIPIHYGMK